MQQLALTGDSPTGVTRQAEGFPTGVTKRYNRPDSPLPDTPLAVLIWIERNATRIEFQQLDPGSRQKNRVIVQYRSSDGELEAVGGTNLRAAVYKADIRIKAATGCLRKAS